MPCDIGDTECYQNFTDICCKINALYSDVDAIHAIVGGDFNCQQGSRFFNVLVDCANDNKFVLADIKRMSNVFTYCSDDGLRQSWIDHFYVVLPSIERFIVYALCHSLLVLTISR